jgi:hypothetical protein
VCCHVRVPGCRRTPVAADAAVLTRGRPFHEGRDPAKLHGRDRPGSGSGSGGARDEGTCGREVTRAPYFGLEFGVLRQGFRIKDVMAAKLPSGDFATSSGCWSDYHGARAR